MEKQNILCVVKKNISEVLNLGMKADQIDDKEPLYSSVIGLDSSGLLKTILKIEKEINIEINDEDIMEFDLETIEDLALLVQKKLN